LVVGHKKGKRGRKRKGRKKRAKIVSSAGLRFSHHLEGRGQGGKEKKGGKEKNWDSAAPVPIMETINA